MKICGTTNNVNNAQNYFMYWLMTGFFQDQAAVPQSSSTVLTVQIQDADDQNPAFTRDHYMAVLPDNPVKVSIGHFQAKLILESLAHL